MSDSGGLDELGWSPYWQALFEPHGTAGLTPARVVRSDRGSALVATAKEVVRAKPSVRLLKAAEDPSALPVVGDWVGALTSAELEVPLIDAVPERRSAIRRGDPGKTSDTQVLAANVDTLFVVHPIAEEPNLRRIERELSLAWDSGANPVVALTKADLSSDPEGALAAVEEIAMGVGVLLVNGLDGASAGQLLGHVSGYRTAALIGPSGAGKSTLIVDSVNPIEITRQYWRGLAEGAGCGCVEVEVVCSDRSEHRRRVEGRVADIAGHQLPTWQQVVDREYEPWAGAVVVDTAGQRAEESARGLVEQIRRRL